jgi:hypothetical protein
MGPKIREMGSHEKLGKVKKIESPLEPPEE